MKKTRTTYKEAFEKAQKLDSNLRADNPGFNHLVLIKDAHGWTNIILNNAFVQKCNNYYIVISEHNGIAVYDDEEYYVTELEMIPIKDFE